MDHYLISASPRSGGHVLMGILQACGHVPLYTHDPLCQCEDYSKINLLLLTRRDLFAAVMSNCIVFKTGQTTDYTENKIEPFKLNKDFFLSMWSAADKYQNCHDLSRPYKQVERFVFEEIIDDYSLVVDRLGLEVKIDYSKIRFLNNRAPYNYKEVITNWQEMKEIFENTDVAMVPNVHNKHHGKRYADFKLNTIT